MYNTKNATFGVISDILSKLTDYDIYSYCIGDFKVGKLTNSPLREDKIPSFGIFKGNKGNLMFKDHGSGLSGNAITFLKEYKHITSDAELEKELLRIISSTAPKQKKKTSYVNTMFEITDPTEIGIVRQDFTETDKQFWGQFGISLETLKKYQVFSIKYFLCNKIVRGIYKDTNPMYAYKVDDKFKIYRPYNTKFTKWRTNLTVNNIQGLSQLPKKGSRKLLIITKSMKDVMVLHEMGYNAISPSSETTFIPVGVLNDLIYEYKKILILFDRDHAGMKNARKYSHKYGFDAFFVHKKFNAKDISDAVKNNGFEIVKKWLDDELQKYK